MMEEKDAHFCGIVVRMMRVERDEGMVVMLNACGNVVGMAQIVRVFVVPSMELMAD